MKPIDYKALEAITNAITIVEDSRLERTVEVLRSAFLMAQLESCQPIDETSLLEVVNQNQTVNIIDNP